MFKIIQKNILLVLIVLPGALFLPIMTVSAEENKAVQKVVSDIQASYEKINDLQSDFVQTVEIDGFDTTYISKGKVFIKKGKMLWDYIEPGKQMIYVNGDGFDFYVPDHKQVIRSRIGGQSDAHLPLKLLSGLGRLDQDFDVSFEIEPPKPGEAVHLKLIPKKHIGVNQIVITFIPSEEIKGLVIDQVVLYEENGNISTSIFEKVQINAGLNDDLFEFEIPEGIEIIQGP
ncbi:MAG: outer membrane lipoprotein carrier protein LolA [Nitrospirae bacterium]|nr:outer membrane lipoprotein carrier protein LolA [Candidatus Manganitrophaceae bacterium]